MYQPPDAGGQAGLGHTPGAAYVDLFQPGGSPRDDGDQRCQVKDDIHPGAQPSQRRCIPHVPPVDVYGKSRQRPQVVARHDQAPDPPTLGGKGPHQVVPEVAGGTGNRGQPGGFRHRTASLLIGLPGLPQTGLTLAYGAAV
jgi:hypothetical protein